MKSAVIIAVVKCIWNQRVDSILIEHLVAVHTLNDRAGSLALSEAGDGDAALVFVIGLVDRNFKLSRIDLYLKARGLGVFLFYILD